MIVCFFNDTTTTEIYTLSLHDALPIYDTALEGRASARRSVAPPARRAGAETPGSRRSDRIAAAGGGGRGPDGDPEREEAGGRVGRTGAGGTTRWAQASPRTRQRTGPPRPHRGPPAPGPPRGVGPTGPRGGA